jgi:predicted lipoprotein with Yx(FWY)xxD motif
MTTFLKRRSSAARTWIPAVGGVAAPALALAACGGASSGPYAAPAASSSGGASAALSNSPLGKILVTYNGHPLYAFVGDSAPGQTTGQGNQAIGAEWDVLSTAGNKIEMGS